MSGMFVSLFCLLNISIPNKLFSLFVMEFETSSKCPQISPARLMKSSLLYLIAKSESTRLKSKILRYFFNSSIPALLPS